MTIEKKKNGAQFILNIEGRLDTTTAPQLEAVVTAELADVTDLILDMNKLDYISSAGLRVLLKAQKTMDAQSGSMKIYGANDEIKEVFEITGFSDILNIQK